MTEGTARIPGSASVSAQGLALHPGHPGAMRGPLPAPHAPAGSGPRPAARPRTAEKSRLDALVPTFARVGVLVGASTAIYAVSLAGVAGLQAADDAAVRAVRAPSLSGVDAAARANDALQAAVLEAGDLARGLGGAYGATAEQIAAYEARLDQLAALVAEVEGSAASLPTRLSLPSVTVRGTKPPAVSAPSTQAKTGASGG